MYTLTQLVEMFKEFIITCEADKITAERALMGISEGNDNGIPDYVVLKNFRNNAIIRIFEANHDDILGGIYIEVDATQYNLDDFADNDLYGYYLQQEDNPMTAEQFFYNAQDCDIKAITIDWTSTEIWINKDGQTTPYYEFTDGIEQGKPFNETCDEFIIRVARIECAKTTIMRA